MNKDIYTDVMDQLRSMDESERRKITEDMVRGNFSTWTEKLYGIIRHHKMTTAEFAILLGVSPTGDPAQYAHILAAYDKAQKES